MIVVEGVTKRYGDFTAIRDVSFAIAEGQVVGFLGPNGAGKTTTMKILTGFMPPTYGRVVIDGCDGFEQAMDLKRRIGYLPEHPPLYLDMVVEDYLHFAAELRDVPSNGRSAAVDRAVEAAGLGMVRDRIIGNCSKGYRQRVGIAQAMVHDPKVLVLDEPTVGLDPVQIVEIRELIRSLAGSRTVILSTHILPEVSAICERIIMINRGRIVGDGTDTDLWRAVDGAESLVVAVRGPATEVGSLLESLPSVGRVTLDDERDGVARFTVRGKEGADPRERISLACAERSWALYELRPPGLTLEEVFVRLTSGEITEGGPS